MLKNKTIDSRVQIDNTPDCKTVNVGLKFHFIVHANQQIDMGLKGIFFYLNILT